MNAHEIIIKPILTEKSFKGIQNKVYTFKVAKKAYGPKGTFTNLNYNEPIENTKNYMDPRMKHDYIFVSKNVKVSKCAHLSDNINNAYPSKHLPVEAYIEF